MSEKWTPAETFPPVEFLREEMEARGWTYHDVVAAMGGDTVDACALDFMLNATQKGLLVGKAFSASLGRAFGVSDDFFLNLDRAWQPEEYARFDARQKEIPQ